MRGDRPLGLTSLKREEAFTPHARGSTVRRTRLYGTYKVYPACAGIDLAIWRDSRRSSSLPRMRGDRPDLSTWYGRTQRFTPHARGSTYRRSPLLLCYLVYPACAGIDPACSITPSIPSCLPRMRGDRPQLRAVNLQNHEFTPHARGSTHS